MILIKEMDKDIEYLTFLLHRYSDTFSTDQKYKLVNLIQKLILAREVQDIREKNI